MSKLTVFLVERIRRSLLASAGLLLFAFGFYLQLAGNVGLSPWPALNQGLANHLPITFGQASILVSVIIVVIDLLMHETIGIGTLLDAFLVGWGSDLFISLELVPYQTEFIPGMAVLMIGLVASCLGQWLYMLAALSCGPRDSLLVGLGKRMPKLSIGTVNILLTLAVALIAAVLGGQIGFGTILSLMCTGIIMDLVFKIVRFEPRSVTHEGLVETVQEFIKAAKG